MGCTALGWQVTYYLINTRKCIWDINIVLIAYTVVCRPFLTTMHYLQLCLADFFTQNILKYFQAVRIFDKNAGSTKENRIIVT